VTQLDWPSLRWPVIRPNMTHYLTVTGTGTTSSSQAQLDWTDGYLS
jgi:hypothetical protein